MEVCQVGSSLPTTVCSNSNTNTYSQHLSMTAVGSNDGEGSDGYDPFLELQPTQEADLPSVNIESAVAGPSSSRPPSSRPASSAVAGQASKPAQRPASSAPSSASKAGKKKRGPVVEEDEEPEEQEQDELDDAVNGQLDGEYCLPLVYRELEST